MTENTPQLDQDNRKLYPKADLPPVTRPDLPQEVKLAPPQFFFPGPNGVPIAIDEADVDRQIQVSILEELRGLRADVGGLYRQMLDVETAVQNSSR